MRVAWESGLLSSRHGYSHRWRQSHSRWPVQGKSNFPHTHIYISTHLSSTLFMFFTFHTLCFPFDFMRLTNPFRSHRFPFFRSIIALIIYYICKILGMFPMAFTECGWHLKRIGEMFTAAINRYASLCITVANNNNAINMAFSDFL